MTDDVLATAPPRRGLPHIPEDSLLASVLLSFLATAGLFGDRGGSEWGVSHYRLKPVTGA